MYNFTNFAMTLNELEPGMIGVIAPTDCRLRPDIIAMEKGDIGMLNSLLAHFVTICPVSYLLDVVVLILHLSVKAILKFQILQVERRRDWKRSRELPEETVLKTRKNGLRGEYFN